MTDAQFISMRPATPDDAWPIFVLTMAAREGLDDKSMLIVPDPNTLWEGLMTRRLLASVAEADGDIVSCAVLSRYGHDTPQTVATGNALCWEGEGSPPPPLRCEALATLPTHAGMGLATSLATRCLEDGVAAGHVAAFAPIDPRNSSALDLFRHLGFSGCETKGSMRILTDDYIDAYELRTESLPMARRAVTRRFLWKPLAD